MMNKNMESQLEDLIRPLVESAGLEFWGLKMAGGKKQGVLKVFIDHEDGVTVDQCAEVSRNLSVMLDVEDPIPGKYSLEVSSPGIEREFFRVDQLGPYIGGELTLHLKEPRDGRRKFTGTLIRAADHELDIEDESGERLTFAWDGIKQARLRYRFPEPGDGKPGKKSKGGK
jgi:ribosome maturation factor RimP